MKNLLFIILILFSCTEAIEPTLPIDIVDNITQIDFYKSKDQLINIKYENITYQWWCSQHMIIIPNISDTFIIIEIPKDGSFSKNYIWKRP